MTWFLVNVQLKILVVYKEATSLFENCKMCIVTLTQHVQIITMRQLRLHFNRLSVQVRTS